MIGGQGLDNGTAGRIAAACTAHHLGEHIECGLRRPEGIGVKAQIRIQNANQRDVRQVQALGHHLGAEKHRDLLFLEPVEYFLVGVDGADGIGIHSGDLHVREELVQLLLGFLSAGADGLQRAAALGTAGRRRLGMAAIVAHEPGIGGVVGQPHRTAGTFGGLPAVHADQRAAVSPSVQEEDGLFALFPGVQDRLPQGDGIGQVVAQLQLLPHVHNGHLGKLPPAVAGAKPVQAIGPGFGPVHGLHRGGGRTKEHQGLLFGTPPDGHFLGRIAGGIFGFVGMLLLFVQNDETEVLTRGKDGGAGANHQFGLAGTDTFPLIVSLAGGEAAVEHRHGLAEVGRHQSQKLGRQGDLRDQQHGAAACGQTVFNEFDVDGGLARAGDAVEQSHAGGVGMHPGLQGVEHFLLIVAENQRAVQLGGSDLPAAQHGPLGELDIAQLFQPVDGGGGRAGKVAKLLHRGTAHTAQQFQHRPLQIGRLGAAGGKLHGFLRRGGQRGDLFRLVIGAPGKIRIAAHPFFPQEVLEGGLPHFLILYYGSQSLFVSPTAQFFQVGQDLDGSFFFDHCILPGIVLRQCDGSLFLKPEAAGEHGPDGVVKGAEITLPEEGRQPKSIGRQHRLFIQGPLHRLQAPVFPLFQGQHHALTAAVAPSEGHGHPHAGQQRQILRDMVGVGLINGKGSCRNSDSRNHKAPPKLP